MARDRLDCWRVGPFLASLESLGMDPGAVDGVFGRRTAEAIRRYEDSKGQPQIGNPDRELLNQLRQEQN